MILASWLLAGLAVVLAWPAPVMLSRAQWPARSPFTAMILWQAIALAGGLSMIGAMLVWGIAPLGDNLIVALGGLWEVVVNNRPAETLGLLHVFALSAACLLSVHLVFTLLLTLYRILTQRRRHRDMLNLLSSPAPDSPATLVINHPAPVAYCLPGGGRSVTVLSDGLLSLLNEAELDAVMRHERAHLTQRHHLLLWAFAAWRAALPWLPTSQLAQQAVIELIEMLADDVSLKQVDGKVLIRAIAIVASGSAGGPADAAGPADARQASALRGQLAEVHDASQEITAHRLKRLLSPQPPLGAGGQAAALAASALLLAVPTGLLVAPQLFG